MTTRNLGRIRPNPCGTYDPARAYALMDLVSINGESWIARGDVPAGNSPLGVVENTHWQLLAGNGAQMLYQDTVADLQAMDPAGLTAGRAAFVGQGLGEYTWEAGSEKWLSLNRFPHIYAYAHHITDRSDPDPENWYWDEAFAAFFAENDVLYTPSQTFKLRTSFTPGRRITWFANQTTLRFDANGTYTEIMHRPSGVAAGEYVGSGMYVAYDTTGAATSRILGSLILATDVNVSDMTLARRQGFRTNLVGFSASMYPGGYEHTIDSLDMSGWGYAFYQGHFQGAGNKVLPYTRMNIQFLRIQRCMAILRTGLAGNGFDDAWIGLLRTSRNVGDSQLIATDMNVGSWFYSGLVQDDKESGTVSHTADSTTVTLSVDNPHLTAGMFIVLEDGALDRAGAAIPHVAYISAKSGTTLTLEVAPERTGTSAYWADPGLFSLSNADLSGLHIYPEYVFRVPFALESSSSLVCSNYKTSGGLCSGQAGASILTNGVNATIDVTLNHVTGAGIKTVVAFGMLRRLNDQVDASILCRVRTSRPKDYIRAEKEIFSCVKLPESAYASGFYTDRSPYTMRSVNAEVSFSDVQIRYTGLLGSVETYEMDSIGISSIQLNSGRINSGMRNVFVDSVNTAFEVLTADELEDAGVYLVHMKHPSGGNSASAFVLVTPTGGVVVNHTHQSDGSFGTAGSNLTYSVVVTTGTHNFVWLRLA